MRAVSAELVLSFADRYLWTKKRADAYEHNV